MRVRHLTCLVFAVLAALPARADRSTEEARERAVAAGMLALGTIPEAHDLAHAPARVADRMAALREELGRNPDLARTVEARAWRDALGGEPTGKATTSRARLTYTEHMIAHLQALGVKPELYRAVIERAYQRAVGRSPHDIEFAYWQDRDALPFILLVACIEHWAQRNAPGLMSTTGQPTISIHSRALHTARLSPAVAAEARAAAGLPQADAWAHAREHLVIAPGASAIAAVGGIHFVAVGRHAAPTGSR